MDNNSEKKYLSLKTAAELYGYTRDHLGLMIRRGKLNGIKLGNYYVTLDEWMWEYIKKYADSNHPTIKNKLSNQFLTSALSGQKKRNTLNVPGAMAPKSKKTLSGDKYSARNTETLSQNKTISFVENDDINSEILKELELYNSSRLSSKNNLTDKEIKPVNDNFLAFSEMPYTILPIRAMGNNEREEVLKKLDS